MPDSFDKSSFVGIMDYHLHTSVTIDGRMDEASACEKALEMGIREIAFTNHIMLTQPDYKISPQAFVQHWEKIQVCQRRFPELTIRLGIEMDYYLDRESDIATELEMYESLVGRKFDIVLGSVHEIDGCFYSNKHLAQTFFPGRDLISTYRLYFNLASRAAASGLFDVIAHPDLIKKYTNDLTPPLQFAAYRDSVETFIETVITYGVGLEVNTKGLTLSVKDTYPSDQLLKLYLSSVKRAGLKPIITLGSDAHRVEEVGNKIFVTANHLSSLGVSQLARFEYRKQFPLILTNVFCDDTKFQVASIYPEFER